MQATNVESFVLLLGKEKVLKLWGWLGVFFVFFFESSENVVALSFQNYAL